jgi:hypothetical protein
MNSGKLNHFSAIVSLTIGVDIDIPSSANPMAGIALRPQRIAFSKRAPSVLRSSQPAPSTM